jgi:hypothetical protein
VRLRQLPLSALVVPAFALFLLFGHVPLVVHSLEDIDSVNFALSLHDFDVRKHQPHPPGYPVVVALGRMSERALALGGVPAGPSRDAMALSINGVIAGALALLPLVVVFRRLGTLRGPARGVSAGWRVHLAAALVVCSPLYWFTMLRPLSDVVGLAFTIGAQALLLTAWMGARWPSSTGVTTRVADRCLVVGAIVAALAIGCRSQAAWLVLPVLLIALVSRRGAGAPRAWLSASFGFAFVVLAWATPTIAASGGSSGYLKALTGQAGSDFAGVDMLATSHSLRLVALALRFTFIDPWATLPLGLAILGASAAGLVLVARQSRRALMALAILALPYLVFHLLFQETMTSRYDLPLVPAVAWLAVEGVGWLGVGAPALVGAAVATSLALAIPASVQYSREGSPATRAAAAVADARRAGDQAVVVAHYGVGWAERDQTAVQPTWAPEEAHEWLAATDYWRRGGNRAVWFLAERRRSDLALVDPRSRVVRGDFEWGFDSRRFMRGARPGAVSWIEVASPPGWFLGEGWGLTPETAGIAVHDRCGLAYGPIHAFVRRRPEEATLVVGGWHLGAAGDPPSRLEVSVDGTLVDAWTASPGAFLRTLTLPAGRLAGAGYAALDVRASSLEGRPGAPITIEQFDVQSAGVPMISYGDGWYQTEFDRRRGRLFHWASPRATLRVVALRDVTVDVAGEVPMKDLKEPPTVVLRAGHTILVRETPRGAFRWSVPVPFKALADAGGALLVESDTMFVPSAAGRRGDDRALALRVFDLAIAATR